MLSKVYFNTYLHCTIHNNFVLINTYCSILITANMSVLERAHKHDACIVVYLRGRRLKINEYAFYQDDRKAYLFYLRLCACGPAGYPPLLRDWQRHYNLIYLTI